MPNKPQQIKLLKSNRGVLLEKLLRAIARLHYRCAELQLGIVKQDDTDLCKTAYKEWDRVNEMHNAAEALLKLGENMHNAAGEQDVAINEAFEAGQLQITARLNHATNYLDDLKKVMGGANEQG